MESLPNPAGNLKSIRDIIEDMKFTVKVPKGGPLVQMIGNKVKLHVKPVVKEKRPNDTYSVNYYQENDWELLKTIIRVTVAEAWVKTVPIEQREAKTSFELSKIFETETDGNIRVKQNDETRTFLFPLLSFGASRPKQSFVRARERMAYKKRIIDLLNRIWMPDQPWEQIDIDAEPYIWCDDNPGNIDKIIVDLTEIVRFKGEFDGITWEEIAHKLGIPDTDKAQRSIDHYALEEILGYNVYNRVLINDPNSAPSNTWPNDEWSQIVLTKSEGQILETLMRRNLSESASALIQMST